MLPWPGFDLVFSFSAIFVFFLVFMCFFDSALDYFAFCGFGCGGRRSGICVVLRCFVMSVVWREFWLGSGCSV